MEEGLRSSKGGRGGTRGMGDRGMGDRGVLGVVLGVGGY